MTADTIILDMLNSILPALTPIERWQAAKRLDSNIMAEQWFILAAVAALIILIILLLWISYNRIVEERKIVERLFHEYAERRGLSTYERQILLEVAKYSRFKRRDAVFTIQDAFERGAVKLMEQYLTPQKTPKEIESIEAELSLLRAKLGFKPSQPIDELTVSRLSSKQIHIGKKVYITRRTTRSAKDMEAEVVKNNEKGLTIKLKTRVNVTFSEVWLVHYYSGKSVWEFDTSAVSYDGNNLVLNHSDSVRLINRRRFLRVPVHNLAFISKFPFTRAINENSQDSDIFSGMAKAVSEASRRKWKPLEFVHAVVTELAGPGLRIEAPLEVKVGERILVVFKLDDEREPSSKAVSKIIEDIGEVKRTKAIKSGFSIAVELIGLRDSDIRELIQAANSASLRADIEHQDKAALIDNEQQSESQSEPLTAHRT
jgi:hypothetical protein